MDLFGYSLWLVLPPEIQSKYQRIISELSTEYNSPLYIPHITLLGEIPATQDEIVEKTAELTQTFSPFPIRLTEMMYQDFYYRSLYILADPTQKLQEMHAAWREAFKMERVDYMPHVSLLYGKYESSVKEGIIDKYGRSQHDHFTISSIDLIQMSGDVSTWKTVHTFTLHGLALE